MTALKQNKSFFYNIEFDIEFELHFQSQKYISLESTNTKTIHLGLN